MALSLKIEDSINILPSDLGNIHWKLANVLKTESKNNAAENEYKLAYSLVDGDTNKEKIKEMINTVN